MKKYIKIIAFASLTLLAANSCLKEEMTDGSEINSDVLSFSATTGIGWNNNGSSSTKSASYVGDMELTDDEGNSINVSMSVLDGIESGPDQMSETKGAMVTGQMLMDYQIGLAAYLHGTDSKYIDDQLENSNSEHNYSSTDSEKSGHWAPVDNHTYYWPKAVNLDFWAWAPLPKATGTKADGDDSDGDSADDSDTGTVEVINPVTLTDAINNGKANDPDLTQVSVKNFVANEGGVSFDYDLNASDASYQPDLMFASALDKSKSNVNTNGCVALNFSHAFAAVQFRVISSSEHKVKGISLIDVTKFGACTFDGTIGWTPEKPSATNKATYSHNFDAQLEKTTIDGKTKYEKDLSGSDQVATFMMIPQTIDGETQKIGISLSLFNDAVPTAVTAQGYIPAITWEAGKTYIYTINLDEQVNVYIRDEINNGVKENIVIKNTSNTWAYLRAAIVAHWCDGNGKILKDYWSGQGTWKIVDPAIESPTKTDATEPSSSSYFNWMTGVFHTSDIGTGWIRGTDGYFYYKYLVPANSATVGKLFYSYTPPTGADAPAGAHLEMSIVVQAIQATFLKNPDGTLKTHTEIVDENGELVEVTKDNAYGWKTNLLTLTTDSINNFKSVATPAEE